MRFIPILLVVIVIAAAAIFVGSQLGRAGALPAGPVEPVWDQQACAHCRMHVGEPPFATQVQTKSGDVLWFDDPGCALAFVAEQHPDVHALWFHHVRDARWVAGDAVAFVVVPQSPMGFGLGAVDADEPGAISLAEARRRVSNGARQDGGMR